MSLNLKNIVDVSFLEEIKDILIKFKGIEFANNTKVQRGFILSALAKNFNIDLVCDYEDIDFLTPYPLNREEIQKMGFENVEEKIRAVSCIYKNQRIEFVNNRKIFPDREFTINDGFAYLKNYEILIEKECLEDIKKKEIGLFKKLNGKEMMKLAFFVGVRGFKLKDKVTFPQNTYFKEEDYKKIVQKYCIPTEHEEIIRSLLKDFKVIIF